MSLLRKNLISVLLLSAALASPAFAQKQPNPPVLDGSIQATGDFGDLFSKWSNRSNWYFGNRMNDVAEIMDDSESTGYHWDGLPHHELAADGQGMLFHFFAGQVALSNRAQIRLGYNKISPSNASIATFVWDAKYDPRFFTGGKAYQISEDTGGDKRRVEHNPVFNLEASGEPTWLMLPATRAYVTTRVGGNGRQDLLSCDEWAQRNVQCALDAPGRNYDFSYARDHITGSNPRAFLVRPGQWYRYIYTLDWRSTPHRIFLWMESEDTPRTLLMADEQDPNKGFVLEYASSETGSDQFWFEFNNSRTVNESDFDVQVKDFFIVKDVLGKDL